MKRLLILTFTLFLNSVNAQDGSDILYYEPEGLDKTLIGKLCHIDFGQKSLFNQIRDTTIINVKGELIAFYEHRVDNGYNNWFSEQYLIAEAAKGTASIRLEDSKNDSLTADKIYLTSTLSYYSNKSPIDTLTIIQHSFDLNDVAMVLVQSKF